MSLQHRTSLGVGASIFAISLLWLGSASSHAGGPAQSFQPGYPRELINHPDCSSTDFPDDPRYCEFAGRM
jgi:hypothetical protein